MIELTNEIKQLFKEVGHRKILSFFFPEIDLTISTGDRKIIDESFELNEQICSTEDITLGACEASWITFRLRNVNQDLSGKRCIVNLSIESNEIPLGTYTVDDAKQKNDIALKTITAYDDMVKTDVDVSSWYNGLSFPITPKAMRESLLTYLNLEFEDQTIINDTIQFTKTVNPTSLMGRDILRRLCELAGGFGHFTRSGKFKIVQLTGMGMYPSETLYPSEDLFPAESGEFLTAGYKKINYAEYAVESITKLQIKQEADDEGVAVGEDGNAYIISENFLLYSRDDLTTIANNILLQIRNKFYRPHETVMVGLPYLEVGDTLTIITSNDAIETFIFKRTLKGIQSLEDTVSATGNQKRLNKVSLSTQIEQLKGRSLKIQKSVDELSSTITDMEQQTETKFQQTSDAISLKASKANIISEINASAEAITISSGKINLNGYATFSSLSTAGATTINGSNITTGAINANLITAGTISGNRISGGTISGTTINAPDSTFTTIHVQGTSANTWIYPYGIETSYLTVSTINSYTPMTSGNYGSLIHTNQITPDLTESYNLDFNGSYNAASTVWCNDTFQPKSASDQRLKDEICSLDDLPVELFLEIQTVAFTYKTSDDGKIYFGVYAQQIEELFKKYGYDALSYNIIELVPVKKYLGEDKYIDDVVHYVNYNNLHVWTMRIVQRQHDDIKSMKHEMKEIKNMLGGLINGQSIQ